MGFSLNVKTLTVWPLLASDMTHLVTRTTPTQRLSEPPPRGIAAFHSPTGQIHERSETVPILRQRSLESDHAGAALVQGALRLLLIDRP